MEIDHLRDDRRLSVAYGCVAIFARRSDPEGSAQPFLGCCSVVVIKYEKLIYVSPLGFVKETHTWVSHHRELLPWNEVKYVTLTTRGSRLMALIEKDEIGWKLFFKKDDLPELKEILKKHAPKVPVNDISPRF